MVEDEAGSKGHFLKLTFKAAGFKDKQKINDIIKDRCAFKPAYIDFLKTGGAIVRFKTKLQADFCVKTLLDCKWNEQKSLQAGKSSKAKQQKLSFGTAKEARKESISEIIEKVDELSGSEAESYFCGTMQKQLQKHKNHRRHKRSHCAKKKCK